MERERWPTTKQWKPYYQLDHHHLINPSPWESSTIDPKEFFQGQKNSGNLLLWVHACESACLTDKKRFQSDSYACGEVCLEWGLRVTRVEVEVEGVEKVRQ